MKRRQFIRQTFSVITASVVAATGAPPMKPRSPVNLILNSGWDMFDKRTWLPGVPLLPLLEDRLKHAVSLRQAVQYSNVGEVKLFQNFYEEKNEPFPVGLGHTCSAKCLLPSGYGYTALCEKDIPAYILQLAELMPVNLGSVVITFGQDLSPYTQMSAVNCLNCTAELLLQNDVPFGLASHL